MMFITVKLHGLGNGGYTSGGFTADEQESEVLRAHAVLEPTSLNCSETVQENYGKKHVRW